jgi:glycosyltransferase involved in cell wall biosynthesis
VSTVHVVVPHGVDDPTRPSGGNTYDRRVCAALVGLGWTVREHRVAGDWPGADPGSRTSLSDKLADVPTDAVVVVDGLVASAAPESLVPEADRLRLVVLVHLPLGVEPPPGERPATLPGDERSRECTVLHAAAAVVATSRWSRDWLLATYRLAPDRVPVVPPGVDPAAVVAGSAAGGRVVCVGAVTPTKGQDLLVEALAAVADLGWDCRCVGSTELDPAFAQRVRHLAETAAVDHRLRFTGPRVGADLAAVYAAADLVVAPSRTETYGMAVTEALARGIPVVGAEVGGLPEALGRTTDGRLPGILVPPGDPGPLADALRRWLTDAGLRDDLRRAARERRTALRGWDVTAERLAGVLAEVAA